MALLRRETQIRAMLQWAAPTQQHPNRKASLQKSRNPEISSRTQTQNSMRPQLKKPSRKGRRGKQSRVMWYPQPKRRQRPNRMYIFFKHYTHWFMFLPFPLSAVVIICLQYRVVCTISSLNFYKCIFWFFFPLFCVGRMVWNWWQQKHKRLCIRLVLLTFFLIVKETAVL